MPPPTFRVSSLSVDRCEGTYEPSKFIGENWIATLIVGTRFVWGRFSRLDHSRFSAVFRPRNEADLALLLPGAAFSYLDGYWGNRAQLVLDPAHRWRHVLPPDLVSYPTNKSHVEPEMPVHVRNSRVLFPFDWDHEHCEICWEKIGTAGQPVGFVNELGDWTCEHCYINYVAKRSLAFVEE